MKKAVNLLSIVLLAHLSCWAQERRSASPILTDPALNQVQNQFMDNQASALLKEACEVFAAYPPQWPEPEARKSALLLLDGVFHDVYAPHREPVQEFYKSRMEQAIIEIEQSEISHGARIWKLYDHGFVIRTRSVCIGFDLIRGLSAGAEGFPIEEDLMERIISQCDVLFISHYHGDHAEEWVAQTFIDQGKPVLAPPAVWAGMPIHQSMIHLERASHVVQTLPLKGGEKSLELVIYPGHQGEHIENNVSLVKTPEGLCFVHMGDQSYSNDFSWMDEVHKHFDVDVLLPNCWTTDIVRVTKGFKPAVMITGHENELGHTIDHREPYWLSYQRREGSDRFGGSRDTGYDTPLILMTWGESYHYQK